jgi:hypothetical protein
MASSPFKGLHTDSCETMLALLNIQADTQALLDPLRVKILDGVVRNITFSPSSVLINPAPIVRLNHLTVPFNMVLYLLSII